MSNLENLVLEQLRCIRAGQDEIKQGMDRVEIRLSANEQTLASMYALSASDRETLQRVIKRVERIERRLELQD